MKGLGDFANGAIFCQLIDLIYEGQADLSRLDWTTTSNDNYAVLKDTMEKFMIVRDIDVSFEICWTKPTSAFLTL